MELATRWVLLLSIAVALPGRSHAVGVDGLTRDLAMYILIGIAGLYFTLLLLCMFCLCCVCYYNHAAAEPECEEVKEDYLAGGVTQSTLLDNPEPEAKGKAHPADIELQPLISGSRPSSFSPSPEPEVLPATLTPILSPIHKVPSARNSPRTPRKEKRGEGGGGGLRPFSSPGAIATTEPSADPTVPGDTPTFVPTPKVAVRGLINPIYQEELALTVLSVSKELSKISSKWFEIGLQLKVPRQTLNSIKWIKQDPEKCLMATCEEWLQTESEPSWTTVVEVLKTSDVNEHGIAEIIHLKYCSQDRSLRLRSHRRQPDVPYTKI